MITKVLILECDYCPRTTRIKGGFVTEEGLLRVAAERGWTRTPDPNPALSPIDRCPKCSKASHLSDAAVPQPGDPHANYERCANCAGSGMDSTLVVTDPYPIYMPHPCGYCQQQDQNDIEATGQCCCAGCVGMGPCDRDDRGRP